MTNELEDRIGSLLTRRADQIDDGPDGGRLALNAERRGRQFRTRRQVLTGIAGAAALAVAAPAAYRVLGGRPERTMLDQGRFEPARPRPVPSHLAEAPTVTFDLRKLPKGAPPAVPWLANSQIHNGDLTTPIDRAGFSPPTTIAFLPTAGGYVVQVADRVTLVDSAGRTIRKLPGYLYDLPVVSADGRFLVGAVDAAGKAGFWEGEGDLVLLDAISGETVARKPIRERDPSVPGFVGDQVVFGSTAVRLWDPATDTISTVDGAGRPVATDGHDRVVAWTHVKGNRPGAFGVFSARTAQLRWETRDLRLVDYGYPKATMDGRYVGGSSRTGVGATILNAATGRKLLHLRNSTYIHYVLEAEPSGDLMFWVASGDDLDDPGALVRCSLDGRCEIAAELSTAGEMPLPWRRA